MKARWVVMGLVIGLITARSAAADFILTATLLGAGEVPPTVSAATGSATVTFLTTTQTIDYDVTYSKLSGAATASHIHLTPAGVNGPVILPFVPNPTGTSGEIMGTLTAANLIHQTTSGITTFSGIVTQAQAGNLYVNIHDAVFPGGEIRGQLAVRAVPEPTGVGFLAAGLTSLLGFAWSMRRRGDVRG